MSTSDLTRQAEARRARRRRRGQSGAAYVESIIVVPALILVLGLIMFVRDGYTKAGDAGEQTRNQGWTNVMSSCTSDSMTAPTQMEDLGAWSLASIGGIAALIRDASTLISNQPNVILSGPALTIGSFRIKRRNYTQAQTFDRPGTIGGQARYGHRIALTCDEDPDYLKMPGLLPSSIGTWAFAIWNEIAWQKADL